MRTRAILLGGVIFAGLLALIGSLMVRTSGEPEQVFTGQLILWCAAAMFICTVLDYVVKRRRRR